MHKNTISKSGHRKANMAERYVFGYQLLTRWHILVKPKVRAGISYKKLELLNKAKSHIIERRTTFLPTTEVGGSGRIDYE